MSQMVPEDLKIKHDWDGSCIYCDVVKRNVPSITFEVKAIGRIITSERGFHIPCWSLLKEMVDNKCKDVGNSGCSHPKSKVKKVGFHHSDASSSDSKVHKELYKCEVCGKTLIGKEWLSCDC